MEAEVLDRIQKMKLTMDEDEAMTIRSVKRDEILEEFSLSLVRRFLTSKQINLQAAKNVLRSMWKLGDDMKIIEVGEGLLQFKFSMESQLMCVWNNASWCFNNHLLALRRWEKGMSVRPVTFLKQLFWIQVWGLPFDLINEEAGSDIGRSIGELGKWIVKLSNPTNPVSWGFKLRSHLKNHSGGEDQWLAWKVRWHRWHSDTNGWWGGASTVDWLVMSWKSANHRLTLKMETDPMGNGSRQEQREDKLTPPTEINVQKLQTPLQQLRLNPICTGSPKSVFCRNRGTV